MNEPHRPDDAGKKMADGNGKRLRKARVSRHASGPNAAVDMGGLPELLGFHLRSAQVVLFQDFHTAFAEVELTPPQYGALLIIAANPGTSQSAVAEALRFDRSTLVQIIDRLEGRGLVVREISANDRRSHALKLTDQGQAMLGELKDISRQHEDRVARALSPEEQVTLKSLLARIHNPDGG